ncbi:unnamed protein product [Clavelina lepadiformis]|uniref:SMB domain-containing protein n=1 Tax=Clavelina lepadiformis TaxID=159417 RepID=A0ABP0GZT5_CLALP
MISVEKILLFSILVLVLRECSATSISKIAQTTPLSCKGRCNEKYNSANICQCNDRCRKYKNCCDDFIPICASLDSCANRCTERYDPNLPCQCNDRCREFRNCCDKFIPICASIDSCARRCAESYNSSLSCQCNTDCQKYDNCCGDYVSECNPISEHLTNMIPIFLLLSLFKVRGKTKTTRP